MQTLPSQTGQVLAVVGSRAFPAKHLVEGFVDRLRSTTQVLSGGAPGVDTWAVDRAKARGLSWRVIKARWRLLGRGAGMARNTLLVKACDYLVAFWDGKSEGTLDSIRKAHREGKLFAVYFPDGTRAPGWDAPSKGRTEPEV